MFESRNNTPKYRRKTGLAAGLSVRDNRGTAILELAILMPFLLIMGLGVMEFGNLMFKRHLIEAGIRDAARYMAGMPDCEGTKAAAVNLANTGTIDGSGYQRVTGWSLTVGDITCLQVPSTYGGVTLYNAGIGGVVGGQPQHLVVRISTTVNYASIGLGLGFIDFLDNIGSSIGSLSFPVQHEERWFGTR